MTDSPAVNFKKNVWTENPIFVAVLGICSTLAVTNNVSNTLVMTVGVLFVTALTNLTVSLLKELIPIKVRMIIQTLIIAFYVIIVDLVLRAYLPVISKALGPYVGLIITNCIIMGRAEAFAQVNSPGISFWDGLTAGFGYMWILIVISIIRESLGSGTLMGFPVFPDSMIKWTIMVTPSSAFFVLGLLIWGVRTIIIKQEDKA